MSFSGKVVVVTGASRDIGKEIARAFAEQDVLRVAAGDAGLRSGQTLEIQLS